jgi:hypothetical protein
MPDNVRRGVRTAVQALIALLLTGALDGYAIEMLDEIGVESDSAIRTGVALLLMFATTWAMNYTEDKTGVALLPPKDRAIGDRALGSGLGEKNPDAGATSAG